MVVAAKSRPGALRAGPLARITAIQPITFSQFPVIDPSVDGDGDAKQQVQMGILSCRGFRGGPYNLCEQAT